MKNSASAGEEPRDKSQSHPESRRLCLHSDARRDSRANNLHSSAKIRAISSTEDNFEIPRHRPPPPLSRARRRDSARASAQPITVAESRLDLRP